MDRNALVTATGIGLILQVAMALGGHYSAAIRDLFALGGIGFSLLAGLIFAYRARAGWRDDLGGGALAGGLCGLLGIAVSVLFQDVPPILLAFGTIASVVSGAIGGGIGRLVFG